MVVIMVIIQPLTLSLTRWVSIMAGVVLADLAAAIGLVTSKVDRVVRTIPNTPCKVPSPLLILFPPPPPLFPSPALQLSQVSQGSVGVTYSPGCTGQDREVVTTIFSRYLVPLEIRSF